MATDKEHLQFIHDRIIEVYGENENVDFLIRMRKIIDKQDTELNLHSISNSLPDHVVKFRLEELEMKYNYLMEQYNNRLIHANVECKN